MGGRRCAPGDRRWRREQRRWRQRLRQWRRRRRGAEAAGRWWPPLESRSWRALRQETEHPPIFKICNVQHGLSSTKKSYTRAKLFVARVSTVESVRGWAFFRTCPRILVQSITRGAYPKMRDSFGGGDGCVLLLPPRAPPRLPRYPPPGRGAPSPTPSAGRGGPRCSSTSSFPAPVLFLSAAPWWYACCALSPPHGWLLRRRRPVACGPRCVGRGGGARRRLVAPTAVAWSASEFFHGRGGGNAACH